MATTARATTPCASPCHRNIAAHRLTLLATSDLHGAQPAALESHLRGEPQAVLWVDNGDLFGGPAGLQLSLAGGDCAAVQWLDDLGLAAMNVGNHDLDQGVEGLLARARQARFAVLSANLHDGAARLLPDRLEVETAAGRVGIAGACTAVARDMWPPSLRRRLRLTDPVSALRASCAEAHRRCERVIALAHLGYPIGPEPAAENPGAALVEALSADAGDGRPLADVIVLGHTHVPHAAVVDRTAILSPPSGGRGLGRARLSDGPVTAELVDTDPAPDPALAARFAPLLQRAVDLTGDSLGDQLLAAARRRGGDGVVVTRRLDPRGPAVRTVGEALARAPLLEPLVLLALGEADVAELLRVRDAHAARAAAATDPQVARRHAWHAFELLVAPGARFPWRLFVPASWSGGYAGYDPFGQARILAEPRLHLVQFLLVA